MPQSTTRRASSHSITVRLRPTSPTPPRGRIRNTGSTGGNVDARPVVGAGVRYWRPSGVWRSLVARSVRVGEVPSSNLGTPMRFRSRSIGSRAAVGSGQMVPFGREYVALCALQAATVLAPRAALAIPWLQRRRVLGLVPLAGIGGVVLLIGAVPRLAADAVDLSAVATPLLALAGLASLRLRLLALAAVPAFLVAWRGSGRAADLGGDALIALACATLAWLTGA